MVVMRRNRAVLEFDTGGALAAVHPPRNRTPQEESLGSALRSGSPVPLSCPSSSPPVDGACTPILSRVTVTPCCNVIVASMGHCAFLPAAKVTAAPCCRQDAGWLGRPI